MYCRKILNIAQSETFDLVRGGAISKQFSLAARTGTLQFSVQQVEARVQLMRGSVGAYSWEGSKIQKGIPVGQNELVCTVSGYRTDKKTLLISENVTTTQEMILQKGADAGGDFVFVKGGLVSDGTQSITAAGREPARRASPMERPFVARAHRVAFKTKFRYLYSM